MMERYMKTVREEESPARRKKRNSKENLLASKNEGYQEVVSIDSDEDNSLEI